MTWGAPRAILLPIAFYLGGTLGVPALNGSAGQSAFWFHALAVLAVVAACFTLRVAGYAANGWFRARRVGSG